MVWRVTAALHPLHDGTWSPDRLDNLLFDPAGADVDGMVLAMARRSCAAIRDLDSLAAVGIDDGSPG